MAEKELISALNNSLNREISTVLRYLLQGSTIKGLVNEPLRQLYREEVLEEMGHAQYLADKIVMMGGTPELKPDLTPPPAAVNDMLKNDIAEEKKDVELYKKLADLAEKAGDIELKMQMEEQAADESRHAQELGRLLA
jgi:bacterioferritin